MKKRVKSFGMGLTVLAGIAISIGVGSCKKADLARQANNTSVQGAGANEKGTHWRPISDYLSAQGTTTLYVPPVPDHVGWSQPMGDRPNYYSSLRFASVDYNGTSAAYLAAHGGPILNTTVTGKIKETEMSDGRAKVTVTLHTDNALIYSMTFDPANYFPPNPFLEAPLDFGYRSHDLLANHNLKPALGNSDFTFTFYNTAVGAPIPDLTDLFNTHLEDVLDMHFHVNGTGEFHALSGYAEHTMGSIVIDEIGLLKQGFTKGVWVPVGTTNDGFPHEVIKYIVKK